MRLLNNFLHFLDLNRPLVNPHVYLNEKLETRDEVAVTVHRVGTQEVVAPAPVLQAGVEAMPLWRQVLMYLSAVVGVLMSSAVGQYEAGQTPTVSITLPIVLLALVIGMISAAMMYKYWAASGTGPILFQIGWFAASGVFWQTLLKVLQLGLSHIAA